jgi:hypothetical protein
MTSTTQEELTQVPTAPPGVRDDRAYLELWFALSRHPWLSVVLVPGHPGGSADEAVRALAEVGQRVSGLPVRAVTLSSLDYEAALALSDLQGQLRRVAQEGVEAQRAIEVTSTEVPADPTERAPEEAERSEALVPFAPAARFVIAVPCLASEPLGLAATQGADAVVFLVELGQTRLAELRGMVEQVGRDRVAGCFLVS